ncbi:Glycosyltransferase [Flavobacterium longum]|uniref:ATP-grasp fold amidoligase family protein n=1 Tax=Flavobacterium longum TaxID=1299340 RepID=UPI0039E86E01
MGLMKFLKRKYKQLQIARIRNSGMSDEQFSRLQVKYVAGQELHLNPPVLFWEKLQWLKLHKYTESYGDYADKYAARQIVADKIGPEYLNELYKVYDSVDEINLDELPNQFALKCTHASGYNVIVKDKSKLDWPKAKAKLEKWMKRNYYNWYRERVYKDIKPRIVAEKYLEQSNGELVDYKFFCFHGEPKFCSMKIYEDGQPARGFFSMDWKKEEPDETTREYIKSYPPKPPMFDEMVEIARKLAHGFIFIRIDLYQIDGKIYFGEFTFFPTAAVWMVPHITRLNKEWGDLIDLSKA